MARLAVTITGDYVNWGLWESVRELVQNAQDANDIGHPMTIKHNARSQKLRIWNDGVTIDTDSLVLGQTTKRGDDRQRGQFGEGYKLAVASLINRGHNVVIRTGEQTWHPTIEADPAFNNARILVINTRKTQFEDRVYFEVDGVSKEDWNEIQSNLLFLKVPGKRSVIKTWGGTILKGEAYANRLYVGGIFVCNLPDDYHFGYDLKNLTLDRDRKLADPYDLRYEVCRVLNTCVTNGSIKIEDFMEVLALEGGEGRALSDHTYVVVNIRQAIAEYFTKNFGENTVPVTNLAEVAEAEHHGFNASFVSPAVYKLLKAEGRTIGERKETRGLERKTVYKLSDLQDNERENLTWATNLVQNCSSWFTPGHLSVVDFFGPRIRGVFRPNGNKIEIDLSRNILKNRRQTLKTLVHEVAHTAGDDGTVAHRDAMDDLYAQIIEGSV